MAVTEQEVMASFRMLVCVARADGKMSDEERATLESAMSGVPMPKGMTVQTLLDEDANLDGLLKQIQSPEAREQAYQAAQSLANIDGFCSPEEAKLLERIKAALQIPDEKVTLTKRILGEAKDTFLPSNIQAIADPVRRKKEIDEDILKYSILNAVLGAFPVPLVDIAVNLASIAVQLKMVRDIGQYHGHQVTRDSAKSLLAGLGASGGARIAVISLCKFVPLWGSAVGAVGNFASTWAVGRIADRWFAGGCKDDMAVLRDAFKQAEKDGKKEYEKNRSRVEAQKAENAAKLKTYAEELKAGTISQAEYEAKVEALAKR